MFRTKLVVGFHPDQATDYCIELAQILDVPFCIVPCCVFPSEFPNRILENGERVRTYQQLIEYLKMKSPDVKSAHLDFHFTETAKNIVLYTTTTTSSIKWHIFPPTNTYLYHQQNDNTKKNNNKKDRKQRQHAIFPYSTGDFVVMMVKRCNEDKDDTNITFKRRRLVPGKVIKIFEEQEDVDNDRSRNRIVHIVPTNEKQEGNVVYTFDNKEQQKYLQPYFVESTLPSTSTVEHNILTRPSYSVVLVPETAPFRRLVQYQLYADNNNNNGTNDTQEEQHHHEQHRVLEIGCSTGELSKLIWKSDAVTSWVGIDNSTEMVDKCRMQLEEYQRNHKENQKKQKSKVIKIDPLSEPRKAYDEIISSLSGQPTIVFLDIGGNREYNPVMRLLHWVFQAFGTSSSSSSSCLQLVVVKSRAVVQSLLSSNTRSGTKHQHFENNVIVDSETGLVSNGETWFDYEYKQIVLQERDDEKVRPSSLFKHPLKAPLKLSPDKSIPICRYHNYHRDGCKSSPCQFDHEYCHACLRKGHIARECDQESFCY